MGAGGVADEGFREDGGEAELLFREALDDGFGDGLIGDEDGLEVVAEGGFDGAGAGVFRFDEGGEDAVDAGFEVVGFVEAGEDVLGSFCEAFAAFDELADGIEAGGALGEDFVRLGGGGACGIEIAAGVLPGALGGVKAFLQFGEAGGGGFDFAGDAGLFGAVFLDFEVEALFLIGELASALAGAFELGEGAFDFRLHGGDDGLAAVGLAAGFAECGFDGLAFGAGHAGALVFFREEDFLLGDAAVELVEGLVGGGEVVFLLGEFFAGGDDVLAVLMDAGFEFGAAFVVEGHAAGGGVEEVAVLVEALAELGEFAFEEAGGGAGFGDGFLFGGELHGELGIADFEAADGGAEFVALGGEFDEAFVAEVGIEDADVAGEGLVAAGLGDLALEGVHAAFLLGEDVGDAEEVGLGVFEFAEGFLFLAFVFGDAGGFLEDGAAFFGFGGEDLVDLALGHDRVGGAADAGVHEEVMDVAEAAEGAVEAVFGAAIAEDAAGDGDLVEVDFEGFLAIGHGEGDFGHAEGFAFFGAVEDDVRHFAAAEGFGGGFAEDPADGVDDVGFAAAVGADDAGDALVEFEGGFVREGLEAVDFERF